MNWLSKRTVSSEVALRALAISLVTFNHAQNLGYYFNFGGGMSFLMMLSGYNFAKFALHNGSAPEIRHATQRLAISIGGPTMLVILGSFILKEKADWTELALISNWFKVDNIALMYIWYPQVLIQILIGIWCLFAIPPLARLVLRNPLWSSLGIFCVAVGVRYFFPVDALWNQLPHLFVWNFVVGWVVYFALETPTIQRKSLARLLALACVVIGGFVGWPSEKANPYVLAFMGFMFIYIRQFTVPKFLGRPINLVSQATFTIFLLHLAILYVYDLFFPQDSILKFSFAMGACVAIWVVWTSLTRAYKVLARARSKYQNVTFVTLTAKA